MTNSTAGQPADAVVAEPSAAGRRTADADLSNSATGMLAETGCTASDEADITMTEPARTVAQATTAAPEPILDAVTLMPHAAVSSASAAHTSCAEPLPAANSVLAPGHSSESVACEGTSSLAEDGTSEVEGSIPASSRSSNDTGETPHNLLIHGVALVRV